MNLIPPSLKNANRDADFPLYFELYSNKERELLSKLKILFEAWFEEFKNHETQKYGNEDGFIVKNYCAEHMSFDGFYPGYLDQKVKILFIAKEGRELSECNYLEVLYPALKSNNIDKKAIRSYAFHRRILYLTYALQNGISDYEEIPWPEEMIGDFGTEKLSYAFMNIYKFSNDEEDSSKADDALISKSVEISTKTRNFIQEEINLLNPDIIITMNLGKWLSSIENLELIQKTKEVNSYKISLNNEKKLVLDTYHFSYAANEKLYFFDSILNAINNGF